MINTAHSTSRVLTKMKTPVYPKFSNAEVTTLTTQADLKSFQNILGIKTPSGISDGLRNYLKLTYPLSSKVWDGMSQNDMAAVYLTLNAHYMPLILPIGKMTIPRCFTPNACVLPPSRDSRTQYWAFDGVHLSGAPGSAIK